MGASVRIEDEAFSDSRYDRLAAELGLQDSDCARGKMLRIWRQCTIEQRHTLDVADVVAILGARGPDALVASRLGERRGDSIRIKGTKGRIEWLKKLRGNGKFGKLGGRPKKNPQGLSNKPSRVSENAQTETPPAPAPAPDHDHEREITRAREGDGAAGKLSDAFGRLLSTAEQDTLRALLPTAEEVERAIAETKARASKPNVRYALTVIESGRKAPTKAASPPRDLRVGYHPGGKPEDFPDGIVDLNTIAG